MNKRNRSLGNQKPERKRKKTGQRNKPKGSPSQCPEWGSGGGRMRLLGSVHLPLIVLLCHTHRLPVLRGGGEGRRSEGKRVKDGRGVRKGETGEREGS